MIIDWFRAIFYYSFVFPLSISLRANEVYFDISIKLFSKTEHNFSSAERNRWIFPFRICFFFHMRFYLFILHSATVYMRLTFHWQNSAHEQNYFVAHTRFNLIRSWVLRRCRWTYWYTSAFVCAFLFEMGKNFSCGRVMHVWVFACASSFVWYFMRKGKLVWNDFGVDSVQSWIMMYLDVEYNE